MLETAAEQMSGGELARISGWILDNTKANWGAMKFLVEKHPQWIMRGCIAHGLALAMKDFTTFTTGRGQNARTPESTTAGAASGQRLPWPLPTRSPTTSTTAMLRKAWCALRRGGRVCSVSV